MAIPGGFLLVAACTTIMREHAPYASGNLRDHGIRYEQTGINEYTIFIGGTDAPYAVYTNEVWVAPYWKGKTNPNEHWIDKGVLDVVRYICLATGGTLSSRSGEDDRWINKAYWESDEGKERLERYKIDDYKSVVSRTRPT